MSREDLVAFLRSLGATDDDIADYAGDLPGLASVIVLRPGIERTTLAEAAESAGIELARAERLWRANGLPLPPADAKVMSEAEAVNYQLFEAACQLFGEEAVLQLVRVIGSAVAKIADAAVSAFLVNVEVPSATDDPDGLRLARANADAARLVPGLMSSIDVLLRRHILAARRSLRALEETGRAGFETQELAVGFADIVGSTALAGRLAIGELGSMLSAFEERAYATVLDHGGRVIKLIGDEVMFVTADPRAAAEIALALVDGDGGPDLRAGLAHGEVLLRDGDCFGPVVNLAARAVRVADPGRVVTSASVVDALGEGRARSLGRREVKGFPDPVELWELEPG